MTAIQHPSVPVTDAAQLAERWQHLLGTEGPPSRRSLVLSWLRPDGTSAPLLVPIDDVPTEPDRALLAHLVDLTAAVAEAEHLSPADLHLALYLERPGPASPLPEDHAWAAAADTVLRGREGVDCSLHVGDGLTATALLPRRSWPTTR
ncbi:hypothetical protein SAMN05660199_03200 [Klenkia soli]|uniref:Uncharacterized protein n=1 Tax=Klenkia soli TaxID=1052260 RepID=A0A1H0Q4J2_9ACTN|nr:hypothetical protein [Klenkia soli]SDP11945.1 hypothetical protein SAMN05660199_03200 [Klenkia soli]